VSDVRLPWKWNPRPYQAPLWNYLSSGGRRGVANWHRRSGKDDVFLHHVACSAFERVGNYWYMLPEYEQARKSMWDAVDSHSGLRRIDQVFPKEIRRTTREKEMMIVFQSGSTFQLVGSDNFNALVGSPPVGLVFSEYALSNPTAWGYLRPILLENGGWAGFNSTPRGNNHFKALCRHAEADPEWFYQKLTAEDTGVFTKEQLDGELREMKAEHGDDYGTSLWMQEYFCSFEAAILGSIYGRDMLAADLEGRICEFDVDESVPVNTAWDLGLKDDTAI
jgi:phage terminase large subunit